jgi:hypothetical protein
MGQDQHYLPQGYLRPWCVDTHLLRYRRVGPNGKLVVDSKAPKSVAFEVDLYTLPPGTEANGLTGSQLESTLAATVDDRIVALRKSVSALSRRITDDVLGRDLIWLMQIFIARSPRAIKRGEDGVAEFLTAQQAAIAAMMQRAKLQSSRDELRKYQDERMPHVAVLAGVATVAQRDTPKGWLDGDVHIVRAEEVQDRLHAIGAGEFVTFEDPVVEWESPPFGLIASFTLSPEALVLLFRRGSQSTLAEYADISARHSLAPLRGRENLICRTRVTGALLAAASELRPTSHGS